MPTASPHPVRVARLQAGMSLEELAFKAGVSFKTLERLERGEGQPRRSTLAVIASALGRDVWELQGEEAA